MAEQAVLEKILLSLNARQRLAVEYDYTRGLQVIAGPGTGKTKVLTSRVAYLLLHHRINPQDIIVTTFTNKAAKEMIDRLVLMLRGSDIRVSDIMIGTFHGICLKILTRFGHKIGLRKDWRIIDEKEIDTIISDMIAKMPDQIRDYANSMTRKVNLCLPKKGGDEWTVHPKLVKKQISRLKAYAILPDEYIKDSNHDTALAYFYERFQGELNKVNALDFDDLLMYTFRLLTKERCLPYVRHVLVDEFQDTNGIQMDLMFLFSRGNHHLSQGITVVGDPDQSIYAFRHALAQNFQAMINKCPIECSRVVLVENYRSSQKILDTSETLIKQQIKGRTDRLPLRAQFDCEFAPVYLNFPATFLEGPSIIRELLYLKSLPNLFTYNDFAILVRQRRQIKNIETALIEHRVPYKILRGHAFWELKETIAMINLLKCIYSDNEKHAIISALQYPARGLGQTSAQRIKKALEDHQGSAFQTLKDIRDKKIKVDIPEKGRAVVSEFIAMIDICNKLCESPITVALSDIFEKLYEMSGMQYEYLHVDGKKKSEVGSNSEPDYTNSRHKNIVILKNYFMGTDLSTAEQTNDAQKKDTHTKVRKESTITGNASLTRNHIRNFFLSLTLFSDEANKSEVDKNKRAEQEKIGYVTISTIHGAKGLEWPVVFIPGCEDGIIPSIFGDERAQSADDEDDEDDDDEENNGNKNDGENDARKLSEAGGSSTDSPKKSRLTGTEDSVDEERRMFFVAQTRAKHLLYLSAVTNAEGRVPSSPSRFLTTDLLNTMVDEQKVFDSVANIRMLYKNSRKMPPLDEKSFSLKQLVEDYAKFIENRRERMIWNASFVRNMYQFDITKNTKSCYTSEFTTAAAQLQCTTRSPEKRYTTSKNGAPVNRSMSPTKVLAPVSNSSQVSPSAKRSFAPNYRPSRNAPNALAPNCKLFAPNQERVRLNQERSGSSLAEVSPSKSSKDNSQMLAVKEKEKPNKIGLKEKKAKGIKNEEDNVINGSLSSKPRNLSSSSRRLIAAPINILDNNLMNRIKREEEELRNDPFSNRDDALNTTAAEILHNPKDTTVDNRPIISNAKTLADAARKSNKSDNLSLTEKEGNDKNKVKKESTSSQIDIFSQLTRAKKKARLNDGEIIVID